jgi:23S rRNA (pseudouridine1915-N3)-methyltransferase
MRIRIIAIGKLKKAYVTDGVRDFQKRVSHYVNIEIFETDEENISKYLNDKFINIVLDRNGKKLDSMEFAHFIEEKTVYFSKDLAFFIGGANGFDRNFIKKFDIAISLSKMTFPHEIARLVLLEQIYRSFTIIKGEKYHR